MTPKKKQNFSKSAKRIRMHPNISECVRKGPNGSEQVRTHPKTLKNLPKLRENIEQLSEDVEKLSENVEKLREGVNLRSEESRMFQGMLQDHSLRILLVLTTAPKSFLQLRLKLASPYRYLVSHFFRSFHGIFKVFASF